MRVRRATEGAKESRRQDLAATSMGPLRRKAMAAALFSRCWRKKSSTHVAASAAGETGRLRRRLLPQPRCSHTQDVSQALAPTSCSTRPTLMLAGSRPALMLAASSHIGRTSPRPLTPQRIQHTPMFARNLSRPHISDAPASLEPARAQHSQEAARHAHTSADFDMKGSRARITVWMQSRRQRCTRLVSQHSLQISPLSSPELWLHQKQHTSTVAAHQQRYRGFAPGFSPQSSSHKRSSPVSPCWRPSPRISPASPGEMREQANRDMPSAGVSPQSQVCALVPCPTGPPISGCSARMRASRATHRPATPHPAHPQQARRTPHNTRPAGIWLHADRGALARKVTGLGDKA